MENFENFPFFIYYRSSGVKKATIKKIQILNVKWNLNFFSHFFSKIHLININGWTIEEQWQQKKKWWHIQTRRIDSSFLHFIVKCHSFIRSFCWIKDEKTRIANSFSNRIFFLLYGLKSSWWLWKREKKIEMKWSSSW